MIDFQRGDIEPVMVVLLIGRSRGVLPRRRVGRGDVEHVPVVLAAVFEIDRRGDRPVAAGRISQRPAQDISPRLVGVFLQGRPGQVIDLVDPAAVLPVPGADAETQLVAHDRAADGRAHFIAGGAALGGGDLGMRGAGEGGQAGLVGDIADRAALCPGAEQRTLRSAQHFDPGEVEHVGQRIGRLHIDVADLHRGVVDIDAGGARSGGGADPADRDVVVGRVDREPRGEFRQILRILDAHDVELFRVERADADRHARQDFGFARGGDHDVAAVGRFGGGVGLRLGEGARRTGQHHAQRQSGNGNPHCAL